MSLNSFKCETHGSAVAYIWDKANLVRKEIGCRLCSTEKSKALKIANKPPKKSVAQKIPYEYTCAPLSGCIPSEEYYLVCDYCPGRWPTIQAQYLEAFKPQPYEWRWNQI